MVAINPNRFGARDAQPLDNYFGSAKDVLQGLFGDDGNKDLPPFAKAAIEQNERIRAIAARKFGDAEGEELLEALCDATVRRPTFITQMNMPPEQVLAMGQFREGMGATVFLLLAWIAEGRSEQPPQREGSHAKSIRPKRRVAAKPKQRARKR
jgi:hypothetical protein